MSAPNLSARAAGSQHCFSIDAKAKPASDNRLRWAAKFVAEALEARLMLVVTPQDDFTLWQEWLNAPADWKAELGQVEASNPTFARKVNADIQFLQHEFASQPLATGAAGTKRPQRLRYHFFHPRHGTLPHHHPKKPTHRKPKGPAAGKGASALTVQGVQFNFTNSPPSNHQQLQVTFSEQPFISSAGAALTLENLNAPAGTPSIAATGYSVNTNNTKVVTFTFDPVGTYAPLSDGNYIAVLHGSAITDLGNNQLTGSDGNAGDDYYYSNDLLPSPQTDRNTGAPNSDGFWFFDADITGPANPPARDHVANSTDLNTISQNYGGSGKTFMQGDSNYDGSVTFADLLINSQHNNQIYPLFISATPTEVTAQSTTGTTAQLSWTAPNSSSVTSYDVWRNFTKVASGVTGTTYLDQNLTPTTTYTYTVVARDAAGDVSNPSSEVSLVTASPITVLIAGPELVNVNSTVNLLGSFTDAALPSASHTQSWTVTAPNNTTAATGSGATISFTATQTGEYQASFNVNDGTYSHTAGFSVGVTSLHPTLTIQGGADVQAGGTLNLSVSSDQPLNPDPSTYVWSVTRNGVAYASGTGASFLFQPDQRGSYWATVSTFLGGQVVSGGEAITVSAAPPQNVTIQGPAFIGQGHSAVFGTPASLPAGVSGSLSYSWSVAQVVGNTTTPVPLTGITTTLPTFAFVPPSQGNYAISLSVRGDGDPVPVTANLSVQPAGPIQPVTNSNTSFVASSVGTNDFDQGQAVVALDNGKFVVAGSHHGTPAPSQIFVAQYNSDLSLDTKFGDGQVGHVAGVTYPSLQIDDAGLGNRYLYKPALAVDTDTGNIIVGGAYLSNGSYFAALCRLDQTGKVDLSFGGQNGDPAGYVIARFFGGAAEDSRFDTIALGSNGEIVAGGTAMASGVSSLPQFALATFDANGHSLAQFSDGIQGHANTAFVTVQPSDVLVQSQVKHEFVSSLVLQPGGGSLPSGLIVGGSAPMYLGLATAGSPFVLMRYGWDEQKGAFTRDPSFGEGNVYFPITIDPPASGQQAQGFATALNGTITSITITSGGSGYSTLSPPHVTINAAGDQGNAAVVDTVTINGSGAITGAHLSSGGTQYYSATYFPVTFSQPPGGPNNAAGGFAIAKQGKIISIVLTNSGSGYLTAPSVSIPASINGGTQATATATLNPDGTVSSSGFSIPQPGTNYSGTVTANILSDASDTDVLNSVLLQRDGNIVAVGSALKGDLLNGTQYLSALRLTPTGTADQTFGWATAAGVGTSPGASATAITASRGTGSQLIFSQQTSGDIESDLAAGFLYPVGSTDDILIAGGVGYRQTSGVNHAIAIIVALNSTGQADTTILPSTGTVTIPYPTQDSAQTEGVAIGKNDHGGTRFVITGSTNLDGGPIVMPAGIGTYEPAYAFAEDLTATAETDGSVSLQWMAGGAGQDGFVILRSVNGTPFRPIATVGPTATVYQDRNVEPATHYQYQVQAFVTSSNQGASNVAEVTTAQPGVTYAFQETVYVPLDGNTPQDGNSASSNGILVSGVDYQLRASGVFSLDHVPAVGQSDLHYYQGDAEYGHTNHTPQTNSTFTSEHIHYGIQIVTATNGGNTPSSSLFPNWGAYSANHVYTIDYTGTGTVLTLKYFDDWYADNSPIGVDPTQSYNATTNKADPNKLLRVDIFAPVPAAPNHLNATADIQNRVVTLSWDDLARGDQQFVIQRSDNGTAFQTVATEPAGTTSYLDNGQSTLVPPLAYGGRYTYRIFTHGPASDSSFSNTASVLLQGRPPVFQLPHVVVYGNQLDYQVQASGANSLTYSVSPLNPLDFATNPPITIGNPGDNSGLQPGEIKATLTAHWPGGQNIWPFSAGIQVTVTDSVTHVAKSDWLVVSEFPDPTTAPKIAAQPTATVLTPTTANTGPTQVSLSVLGSDDGGEANLTYTWEAVSFTDSSNQPGDVPDVSFSDNGTNTAKDSIATLSRAGTYTFRVEIADANGQTAPPATAQVTVNPYLTGLSIDPNGFALAPSMVQPLTADGLDQFGQLMNVQGVNWGLLVPGSNPPQYTTSIANALTIDNTTHVVEAATVGTGGALVPSTTGGHFLVHVTAQDAQGHGAASDGSVDVETDALPALQARALATSATNVNLDAVWSDGTQRLNTTYMWVLTNAANGQQFNIPTGSGNGTAAAQHLSVTVTPAGTYNVSLVASDPTYVYNDATSVMVGTQPNRIVVTAAINNAQITSNPIALVLGHSVTLTAQEFLSTGSQNTGATFTWQRTADNGSQKWAGGSLSAGTGATVTYTAPTTMHTQTDLRPITTDQITVTAGDGTPYTFNIQVLSSIVNPTPVVQISSIESGGQSATGDIGVGSLGSGIPVGEDGVSSSNPPPPGQGGTGGPQQISADSPVLGTIAGASGDPVTWTLTAQPLNDPNAAAITIASGSGDVPSGGSVGTLRPEDLFDGLYTITLTATDTQSAPAVSASDSRTVSVFSNLKLGNLTLPFTDLTVPNPSGSPVTISRVYDSNQATKNDKDFGPGWRFAGLDGSLRTTLRTESNDRSALPGFHDGDMVYITLPNGRQHAFEFVAKLTDPLDATIASVTDYHPQFIAVDGSNATLTDAETAPDAATLKQDSGLFIDTGLGDPGLGNDYNPADPSFGGAYVLTEQDGTKYTISARNIGSTSAGQITSVTDPNGNTTSFTPQGSAQGDTIGTSNASITVHRDANNNNRIQWVVNTADQTTGVNPQLVPASAVYYSYDEAGNLMGVTTPAQSGTSYSYTTYIYADQLTIPYTQTGAVSAVVTLVNPPLGTSPTTYTVTLDAIHDAKDNANAIHWYTKPLPTGIPAGTKLSISYYLQGSNNPIASETKTYNGAASAHVLTSIIDPRGVRTLSADFNAAGQMTQLSDSANHTAPVNTGDFEGSAASQTVTDLSGNSTENQYDAQGDVTRSVQEVTDSDKNPVKWIITRHTYQYASDPDAAADVVQYGNTIQGRLSQTTDYQPIEIFAPDTAGDRFTAQPTQVANIVNYKMFSTGALSDTNGLFLPSSEIDFAADGTARTTTFLNYTNGKPKYVTTPDGTTTNFYDGAGNLTETVNSQGDITSYTYTAATDGIPAGLLWQTFKGTTTSGTVISTNLYYGTVTNGFSFNVSGQPNGMLYSSQSAGGPAHIYTYNQDGVKTTDTYKWTDSSNNQWTVESDYVPDALGRITSSTTNIVWRSNPNVANDPNNPKLYYPDDVNHSVPLALRYTGVTTSTHYNAAGQQDYTYDQYHQYNPPGQTDRQTNYLYDSRGNVVATVYPDGTETRTVYDAMGRAVWTTQKYASTTRALSGAITTLDNTTAAPVATETLYDALGHAIQTLQYTNIVIPLTADLTGGTYTTAQPTLAANAAPFAAPSSNYNPQGVVQSQTDASGLRTGNVYYSNGQVQYTGQLRSDAPVQGPYTTANFVSYTTSLYDPQGQVATLTPGGTIVAGSQFCIKITSTDEGAFESVIATASGTTVSGTAADIANAINNAALPSAGYPLFQGITAVALPTGVRLVADPSHSPFSVTTSANGPSFTASAINTQTAHVMFLAPSGTISGSDSFTVTLTDPNNISTTQQVTAQGLTAAALSANLAQQINSAVSNSNDPLFANVAAADERGYVRLILEGSSFGALPIVTASTTSGSAMFSAYGLHTNVTIDPDGHWTATQSDPAGHQVLSVAPDGGVTQTLFGANGQPVPAHEPTPANGIASQVISGYQQTQIDPLGNATDSFYDSAGRLTDVYQPPVQDAYVSHVLNDRPTAYWRLGESTGTVAGDSGGNSNTGAYHGSPALSQSGALWNDSDEAAKLATSSDYVQSNFTFNSATATVEAWVKLTAIPTGNTLVAGCINGLGNGAEDKDLYIDSGGHINWYVYDGAGKYVNGPALSLNTWYHLVGTCDGTTSRLYVNGKEVGNIAAGATYTGYTVNNFFVSGGGVGFGGGLQATVDEVALYDHALPAADIQAHFDTGVSPYAAAVTTDAPALYWRLGETSGTTSADTTGNAHIGSDAGTYTLGASGALAGDSNTALSLTNGSVASNFVFNSSTATVEAWVKLTALPTGNVLLAGCVNGLGNGASDKLLYIDSGGHINWYVYDGAGKYVNGPALSLNTWYHLVGTCDGTTSRLYVNGSQAGSVAAGPTYTGYTVPNFFVSGGNAAFAGGIHAVVDEVALYGNALSAARVQAHYAAGVGVYVVRPHWNYSYDIYGNQSQTTDPNGHVTAFGYNPLGNETSRTLPDGEQETSTYNGFGQLAQHTDFQVGSGGNTATYTYYYEGSDAGNTPDAVYAGLTHTVTYAGPGQTTDTVTYTYDNLGQRLSTNDSAAGQTTTYSYDPITGQVSQLVTPQGEAINYAYDPASGKEIEAWTGASATTTKPSATTDTLYGYDIFGRLASVTAAKQNGSAPAVPAGVAIYAPFDAAGHALPTAGLPTTLYQYDAAGNLVTILDPNNTETDYSIDPVHDTQTTTDKVTSNQGTLASYAYQLDAKGRKVADTETRLNNDNSTFSTTQIAWTYDALSRLTKEVYSEVGDAAESFIAAYEYDLANNRVEKTLDKSSDGTIDESIAYSYVNPANGKNGDDRLYSTISTAAGTTTFTYDNNGSMLTQVMKNPAGTTTESDTFQYDSRNRLLNATVAGVNSVYGYNDDGDRVSNVVTGGSNPGTTAYIIDPNNPSGYRQVIEDHQSSGITSYVLALSGVIATSVAYIASYSLSDGQGSTRLLTNSNGGVVGEYDFDAFGNQVSLSASAKAWTNTANTPYRYVGLRWDPILAQHWTETRPYSPALGRFPTADSYIAGPGDWSNANLFVYVGNDPLTFTDPSGRFLSLAETLIATAGILLIAGLTIGTGVYLAYQGEATSIRLREQGQQVQAQEIQNMQAELSRSLAPSTDPQEVKDEIQTEMERDGVRSVLFHYTNAFSAIEIEETGQIKAAPEWQGRNIRRPSGAWATDIAPYDLHYTQQDLKDFFSIPDAGWYVAVGNDDNGFQPRGLNAFVKWPNVPANTLVPVKVVWIGENAMHAK